PFLAFFARRGDSLIPPPTPSLSAPPTPAPPLPTPPRRLYTSANKSAPGLRAAPASSLLSAARADAPGSPDLPRSSRQCVPADDPGPCPPLPTHTASFPHAPHRPAGWQSLLHPAGQLCSSRAGAVSSPP